MSKRAPFQHVVFNNWIRENEAQLRPPVCNKLMYGGKLKVMFVGGKLKNDRSDYHLEEGEEFFYMIKGSMVLKVIENGKRRDIVIKEGESFLLPPNVPHSPQRFPNSLGLVVERERLKGEIDALEWYVEGSTDLLWKRSFVCTDLGKDLVPVIKAFKASEAFRTGKPVGVDPTQRIFQGMPRVDAKVKLEAPRMISEVKKSKEWLQGNGVFSLYSGDDFKVFLVGRPAEVKQATGEPSMLKEMKHPGEAYYFQVEGSSRLVSGDGKKVTALVNSSMVLVEPNWAHSWEMEAGSFAIMLVWPEPQQLETRAKVSESAQ